MGFSFRSLYTDDDQLEQRAVLSALPAEPASISVTGRPILPNTAMSGIPGPLKRAGAIRSAIRLQTDHSSFTSLDELEPESDFHEKAGLKQSDVIPIATAPAARSAPVILKRGGVEAGVTLRAIFSTSDEFTLDRIASLTAGLPGIVSCIIKTPEHAILATGESDAVQSIEGLADFPHPESYQSTCDLLGLGKLSGVMLRSESGPVSCFSCAEVSLMARHSEVDLEPGLWEKLTLITQATAELNA